jgi:hypothetical protein
VADDVPANAKTYLPVLKTEQGSNWPDHPDPAVLAGQVEKETCVTLKSAKCWSPRTELKTSREYGFGFGQTTVAYDAQGKERFNTWKDLRARWPTQLAAWTWGNRYAPEYQLRAMVLYDRLIFRMFDGAAATPKDQLAFGLAGYNGGPAGTLKEIRVCKTTAGCDAGRWFGHVEKVQIKSTKKWQGYGKSAWQVNREYPDQIINDRAAKYRPYFQR